jgi:hypothetical protein
LCRIEQKAEYDVGKVTYNKSLHGPMGACHGSCSEGNRRARHAVARELKRYTSLQQRRKIIR